MKMFKINNLLLLIVMLLGCSSVWGQATLPFDFTATVRADIDAVPGLSESGIGSDYAATHAPYRLRFDDSGDYMLVHFNAAAAAVSIGVKMVGGSSTSTFHIESSSNLAGPYTSIENFTVSGSQNTIRNFTTSNPINSTHRYIKIRFIKGSNVGLGVIKITEAAPSGPTHDVIFNSNGGTGTMANQSIGENSSANLNSNTFSNPGFSFAGWSTTPGGSVAYADGASFSMGTSNVTLYAKWDVSLCADGAESFETGLPTAYGSSTYTLSSGKWSATNVIRGTTGVSDGSYSLQIRSQTGAQITSPKFPSVGKLTFTAAVSTTLGRFQVNISTDGGGSWNPAAGSPFTSFASANTTYPFSIDIDEEDVMIQFYRTEGTIYIDDIKWTCLPPPTPSCTHTITNFTPANGPVGTMVTIAGTGFTSSSTVSFDGKVATTTYIDGTTLKAVVPAGATTGKITVAEGSCDVVSSSDFTVETTAGVCGTGGADYEILIWHNGVEYASTHTDYSEYHLKLTGTIPNNTAWVIGCGGGVSSGTGNPLTNHINMGFNANERIVLYKNGTPIDRFGTTGTANWMTVGHNYRRNATVTSPRATYLASEWTIVSYTSSLGSHSFNNPLSDIVISEVADPSSGNLHYIEIYNGTGVPISFDNSGPPPPSITSHPSLTTGCSATFSVTASPGNGGALTYQWYYQNNNGGTWTAVSAGSFAGLSISGFDSNSLSISGGSAMTSIDGYQFYCKVTESGTCSVFSNAAQYELKSQPYFRSVASGDWMTVNNWETANNLAGPWIAACEFPIASNSSKVFIESATHITVTNDATIDYLEIKHGGTLEVAPSAQLAVHDSTAGADFIVNGTFLYRSNGSHSFSFGTGAKWSLGANATFIKTNGAGIVPFRDNYQGGISTIPATAKWIYRYNGDGNPTMTAIGMYYPHLWFENTTGSAYTSTGNAIISGSTGTMVVKGNLEIGTTGSAAYIQLNTNSNATPIRIDGNLTIGSGSELKGTTNATGYELKGNLTVNGKLELAGTGSRILKFSGNANQTVSGTGTIDVHHIEVNKTAGNVLLNRNLQATGVLTMTAGHIYTSAHTLELGKDATDKGTLTYTNGYVVGTMKRWFGNNAGDKTIFPLGFEDGGLKNRFAEIEYTAASSGGDLTVTFTGLDMTYNGLLISAAESGGFGSDITNAEDQGYWTCTAGSLSGGTYTASFTGEGFSEIVNLTDITLLKRENASAPWKAPGTHVGASGTLAKATVSRDGLSGFSDFGFGSKNSANPLPIELISFSASCGDDGEKSTIQWITATETNNDYFTIEKSTDGKQWDFVEKVNGRGNYNFTSNYAIQDRNIGGETTYYRLTQVDYNGKSETFNPISLTCQTSAVSFQTYPNPANDFTTVALRGYNFQNGTLSLYTTDGKLLQYISVQEKTDVVNLTIDLQNVPQGIYLLHWEDGSEKTEVKKLTVK